MAVVDEASKEKANETFSVALGAISRCAAGVPGGGGTITTAGSPQTGTITNDDSATVTLTPLSETNLEGTGGTTTAFTFNVTLSAAVQGGLTVAYATNDGTATTADLDYVDNDGSLVFAGPAETKMITVLVNQDNKVEGNETFNVALG